MSYTVTSNPGTGPYRRVYSRPGFSYSAAQIVLPPVADVQEVGGGLDANGQPLIRPNGDQCYAYLGGWGDNGGAVDAGLIHSPAYGHWSVFMSCEGIGIRVDPSNTNLKPDQVVFVEFYVPSDGVIQLNVTGFDMSGNRQLVSMSMQPKPEFGWNADGAGVIMKRMTTIGQAPREDLYSGSYIRNIHWQQCVIGTSHSNAVDWAAVHVGGYESYPTSGQVNVQYVGPAEETDTIDLSVQVQVA